MDVRMWLAAGAFVAMVLAGLTPAVAKPEPFGQETVEVRSWRNAPRPGASPGGHRHKHQHSRRDGHSHPQTGAQPHEHRHDGTRHDHSHDGHTHRSVSTEFLFGFTRGSDIDAPGVNHVIASLDGAFGKRTGSYSAWSQHFEYAVTPWRDFHFALGASFAQHRIAGVEGLEDTRHGAFEGFSVELRQRLLDRSKAPFGLTLSAEPHVARLDETSGERAHKFAVEFNLAADKELIKDRLYGALNFIYEPEWVRIRATGEAERASTLGLSLAVMTPLAPWFFIGGEARYLRSYEGVTLDTFAGRALFVGPVVYANVNDRLALVAAFSTQVSGRAVGGEGPLDLENFERHRAKLKAVFHF